jgi:hypothetical protein
MARRTLRSVHQSAIRLPPLLDRLIAAEARDASAIPPPFFGRTASWHS